MIKRTPFKDIINFKTHSQYLNITKRFKDFPDFLFLFLIFVYFFSLCLLIHFLIHCYTAIIFPRFYFLLIFVRFYLDLLLLCFWKLLVLLVLLGTHIFVFCCSNSLLYYFFLPFLCFLCCLHGGTKTDKLFFRLESVFCLVSSAVFFLAFFNFLLFSYKQPSGL